MPLPPAVNDLAWNAYLDGQSPAVELRTAYEQLKPTERAFVDEFVATDDPRGAAIAAQRGKPQQNRSPDARALDFMKRPLVQAAIAERMRAVMERLSISQDRVLEEVAKVAFANMGDYTKIESGEPIPDFSNVNADMMAAVSEISTDTYVEGRGEDASPVKKLKFKLHDKMGALDKLMRYHGLYAPDKVELTGKNGAPIETRNVNVNMTAKEAADLYQDYLGEKP